MHVFKILLCLTMINFSLSTFATENYEDLVLEAADNICGDTWCEGDFDFEFTNFSLSESDQKANLQFTLIFEGYGLYTTYPTKCNLAGYSKVSAVIEKETYYSGYRLTDKYYEELSLCIANEEAMFRTIIGID